jgi:hypothetical protein
MTGVMAAIATAVTAVVGLVLYLLKQRTDPAVRYDAACQAYKEALKDETRIQALLQAELDEGVPDRDLVRGFSNSLAVASRRVRECRKARDRLRP